jgi:thioredoxin-related protein
MKMLFFAFLIVPLVLNAQNSFHGIHFVKGLSWEQVKAKAKAENKYIFVDCYTTWCLPCKQMEQKVFHNDTVSKFLNQNYVSLKLQIDTSKNDNDEIKKLYSTAQDFVNSYSITGFPTFLFFSPNGEIVHKGLGSKSVPSFVSMAREALDISKQNYKLVHRFNKGELNFVEMRELAVTLKELGDEQIATKVAKEYIDNYLNKLNFVDFASKENINFLYSFYKILTTRDRAFQLFYKYDKYADSVTANEKGFAWSYAYYLIFNEMINPILDYSRDTKTNPNWRRITGNLKDKYPKLDADEMVTNAKISWYKYKKEWEKYVQFTVRKIEKKNLNDYSGWNGINTLNAGAWEVFLHSKNKKIIKKAILWVDMAMNLDANPNVGLMDTKANLLYKAGQKDEAITLYKQIVKLDARFIVTLQKMEKGIPTWADNGQD